MNSSHLSQPRFSQRHAPSSYASALQDGHDQHQHPGNGIDAATRPRLQQRSATVLESGAIVPNEPAGPAHLPHEYAQPLAALRGQIDAIRPPLTRQLDAVVAVFASVWGSEPELKDLLKNYPKHPDVSRCRKSLARLLNYLGAALAATGTSAAIDPDCFTSQQIQTLCKGLAACGSVTGGLLLYSDRDTLATLQKLTDILLIRAMKLGLPEAVQAIGEVLDILNWLSRGLKAGLLEASGPIKRYFEKSLVLIHEWTGNDQCRQLLSDYNLGRCAVQIATVIKHACIDLQTPALDSLAGQREKPEQLQTNAALLQQCVLQLCAPAILERFTTAPADTIALLSVCNMVKYAIEKGLLAVNDALLLPALNQLVQAIGMLPEHELISVDGDCRRLSNFSNFLRRLGESEDKHQPAYQQVLTMFDPVCHSLIACINGNAFKMAHPDSQSLTNLVSFVKICDKRLERRNPAIDATVTTASTGSPATAWLTRAELVEAAGRLSAGVLRYGARYFDNPQALGGLGAGLVYLWQRNLAPRSAAMSMMMNDLLARIERTGARGSTSKSNRKANSTSSSATTTLKGSSTGSDFFEDTFDSTPYDPSNITASIPAYVPSAIKGAQQQQSRKQEHEKPANYGKKAVAAATKKKRKAQTPVKKKDALSAAGKAVLDNAQAALGQAILAGQASEVTQQFQQKASWSNEDIRGVLDHVTGKLELIDKNIVAALQAFLAVVRQAQPGTGAEVLTRYFELHPARFAALQKLLADQGLVPGKVDAIEHARVELAVINSTDLMLKFIENAARNVLQNGNVIELVLEKVNSILVEEDALPDAAVKAKPFRTTRQALGLAISKKLAGVTAAPGVTVLMIAAQKGHAKVVQLLLELESAHAQATVVNQNGSNALMMAAASGRPNVVKQLLATKSADAQATAVNNDKLNALMFAVSLGHGEIIEQLLATKSADAQTIAVGKNNFNALMLATASGQPNVVRQLLTAKSADAQATAVNNDKSNALMLAAALRNRGIVEQLSRLESARAQAYAVDANGSNALAIANAIGCTEIVKLLQAHAPVDV